jgi:hypothetical protein
MASKQTISRPDVDVESQVMTGSSLPADHPSVNSIDCGKQDHAVKTESTDISITSNTDCSDETTNHDEFQNRSDLNHEQQISKPHRRRTITIVALILVALSLGLSLGMVPSNKTESQAESTSESASSTSSSPGENILEENKQEEPDAVVTAPPFLEEDTGAVATLAPNDEDASSSSTKIPINVETSIPHDEGVMAAAVGPENFQQDAWQWPALVGLNGQKAADLLEEYYPGKYDIYVLPDDSAVTMDYDVDRIRIFVDNVTGLVSRTPMIG